MAVSYTTTVGTTDYGFDWVDSEIEIEALVEDVSAADLKTAIRRAEADVQGIVWDSIADTFNPVTLTPTSSTFLNVILFDPWKVLSLSTGGSFTVGDGNVVSQSDGVDIFAANVLVSKINNTSSAGVLVGNATIDILRKLLQNRNDVNDTSNKMEVYNDAGTVVEFDADIYEDVAGTTPWDGTGPIVRRDKLTPV